MLSVDRDLPRFAQVDAKLDERALDEASADAACGNYIPHADVQKWLQSWDTNHKLPAPKPA
jgi:predicted transcriptional regulator